MNTISALSERIKVLEHQLSEIQMRCRHVFLETSDSDQRICIKCYYAEKIIYKFGGEDSL